MRSKLSYLAWGLLVMTSVGCAGTPSYVAGDDAESSKHAGLSGDLIYEYMLGRVAARRGEGQVAASAMAKAAALSSSVDITVQAFSLSMNVGQFEQALALSDLMNQVDPQGAPERRLTMRLQALIALDREDDVFDTLVALVDVLPESEGELVSFIAQTLGRQEDADRWVLVMERLATHLKDQPSAQLALAWLAYRTGKIAIAEDAYDRAMALKPGCEEAALLKLSHLSDKNSLEEASAFASQFLTTFPDRLRLRLNYGRLLAQWNQNIEALAQFEALLKLAPENIDALYAAGVLSEGLGQMEKARQLFERLLVARPEEDRARLYLGQILSRQGETEAALVLLGEVVSSNLYLDAQLRIGFVLSDDNRIEEAIEHLSNITPKSQDEQVRIYLATEQVFRDSDQLEKALSLLDAALIDIPDHPDLLYARGLVTAMLDRIDDHERDMRRLISIEPENPHAYNALGYTLADKTDRLVEALELIEKALTLSPGDPFILDSLGWVHYRRGDLDSALELLQQAIEQQPDAEIAAHLGEVLWQMGDQDGALIVWQGGQQNNPDNAVLIETLRRYGQ